MRGIVAALLCLIGIFGFAQKFTASPVTVEVGKQAVVTVSLEEDTKVAGGQFDIVLPEGISMVGTPKLTGAAAEVEDFELNYSDLTQRLMILSYSPNTTFFQNGPVLEFTVAASADAQPGKTNIELNTVRLSVLIGSKFTNVDIDDVTIPLTVTSKLSPKASMSFNASEVLVNGDGTAKFTLAMSTNFDAPQAMDFVITFPEGMTYEGYEKTDRWCDRTRMTINPRVNGPEGAYGVAIYNMSTNQSFTGTEGDFITFVVKGSDALAKVSEITVTKATVST